MHLKKLTVTTLLLSSFFSMGAYTQDFSDDCHIDLDEAGIQVKVQTTIKNNGSTNLDLMYTNPVDIPYD